MSVDDMIREIGENFEVFHSDVAGSRVHELINHPFDEGIDEGLYTYRTTRPGILAAEAKTDWMLPGSQRSAVKLLGLEPTQLGPKQFTYGGQYDENRLRILHHGDLR